MCARGARRRAQSARSPRAPDTRGAHRYKGPVHLAWAFPLPRPAYLLGGEGLHSLLMFAPIVCVSPAKGLETALLLIFTGPVLAMILAPNGRLEQASIWCFISVIQICIGGFVSARECEDGDGWDGEKVRQLSKTSPKK